ncbi:hypothetical protein PPEP_a0818 [Pseudoalteromonas peptidolytica F12-50-A1]|uniref:Uncharacterized protein n=1 Tax=Pseudoalteromonas peptidolytica F12-50-A1 TaxID=1315280 RepID=A0A8I0MTZ7_9GAMM|nr:hypothetical protein [Pseudoalteromonas peptidolytica F12-50-A1]
MPHIPIFIVIPSALVVHHTSMFCAQLLVLETVSSSHANLWNFVVVARKKLYRGTITNDECGWAVNGRNNLV